MIDIIEVAKAFVQLHSTQVEGRYSCKCPFHPDKNPSLFFFRDTSRFYCFGCKASGDVFSFLQNLNNWTWRQSRDYLQSIYPEYFADKILKVVAEAAKEWQRELTSSPENIKRVTAWGFNQEIQRDLKLGLANFNSNSKILKGLSTDLLKKAGLISQKGDKLLFINRIIIPLPDAYGRIIGFQGRAISVEEKSKYLTIYNSEIFERDSYIYGEEHLRGREEEVVLVEGVKDLFNLKRFGISAISCLGTNLGSGQLKKLEQFLRGQGNSLIIMFDGDTAGKEGARKICSLLKGFQNKIKLAEIEEKADPAELMQFEIEQAIYLARSLENNYRREWKLNTRPSSKFVLDLILPNYISKYLNAEKGPSLRIPSQEELSLIRVFVSSLRLKEWLKASSRSRLKLETLVKINKNLFLYKLFLSTKGWNYEHNRS